MLFMVEQLFFIVDQLLFMDHQLLLTVDKLLLMVDQLFFMVDGLFIMSASSDRMNLPTTWTSSQSMLYHKPSTTTREVRGA